MENIPNIFNRNNHIKNNFYKLNFQLKKAVKNYLFYKIVSNAVSI